MLQVSPAEFDDRANRAWPGLEVVPVDGWLVRLSGGVTRRANSVFPRGPVADADAAIDSVERIYRARDIRPAFQVSPGSLPGDLDERLTERGYRPEADTLGLIASITEVTAALAAPAGAGSVTIADRPDHEWLDLWWSVDGRGGARELEIARRILEGNPSRYATMRDGSGAVSVGRLALVDEWGGLFALATRPDARRRGHAGAVMAALVDDAAARGTRSLWLQVLADNAGALALYEGMGFAMASSYRYWIAPS